VNLQKHAQIISFMSLNVDKKNLLFTF
jgi:hypothetical protein